MTETKKIVEKLKAVLNDELCELEFEIHRA